ncbi:MAG: Cys-tRNA(Pro) deacylase [Cardiobacteriaceae bacterium]|nr:Cys-tRNA(Pro) deacylase [Cardiobacteriaceae bacterium]
MAKDKFPVTPAIRFLRSANITPLDYCLYQYEEKGGAKQAAEVLKEDLHKVVKTIVFIDECKKGLVALMNGDCEVSSRNLARITGRKSLEPASANQANKWTGYLFGGTSPFGLKTALPIFVEKNILDLEYFWINGGKQGFQIKLVPENLTVLNPEIVSIAV